MFSQERNETAGSCCTHSTRISLVPNPLHELSETSARPHRTKKENTHTGTNADQRRQRPLIKRSRPFVLPYLARAVQRAAVLRGRLQAHFHNVCRTHVSRKGNRIQAQTTGFSPRICGVLAAVMTYRKVDLMEDYSLSALLIRPHKRALLRWEHMQRAVAEMTHKT